MNDNSNIPLPAQEEGAEKNIESTVTSDSVDAARHLFQESKQRLINVNEWHQLCGKLSAVFQLTDNNGKHIYSNVSKGNYFKIDIPGPGSASGKGFDWVVVDDIEEKKNETDDTEFILIRVRPVTSPVTSDDNVAHFFSNKATSNFVVKREKNIVTAAVYGRNETPNTETDSIIDKARNAVIGLSALAGFSNPQWKNLTQGLLEKKLGN